MLLWDDATRRVLDADSTTCYWYSTEDGRFLSVADSSDPIVSTLCRDNGGVIYRTSCYFYPTTQLCNSYAPNDGSYVSSATGQVATFENLRPSISSSSVSYRKGRNGDYSFSLSGASIIPVAVIEPDPNVSVRVCCSNYRKKRDAENVSAILSSL